METNSYLEGKTIPEIICAYNKLYSEKNGLLQALDVVSGRHGKYDDKDKYEPPSPKYHEPKKCCDPPKCEPKCDPPKCEPKCDPPKWCEPKCESQKCWRVCDECHKFCCDEKSPEYRHPHCDEVDIVAELQRELVELKRDQATYRHTFQYLTTRLDNQGMVISQLKIDLAKIVGVIYRRKC